LGVQIPALATERDIMGINFNLNLVAMKAILELIIFSIKIIVDGQKILENLKKTRKTKVNPVF
jgi:hypothetical protein